MQKVGRNAPCPCGSGKKYKHCHGSPQFQQQAQAQAMQYAMARAEAQKVQRESQQGLGKPIISAELDGRRLVAVKNRLLQSKGWRTFHDFLGDYIKMALGEDWGNADLAKPLLERHPILIWYHHLCLLQQAYIKNPGQIAPMPKTGAAGAYLQLAYDLYALDHNAELQEKLVNRLRDRNNFEGARYEVYVAAMLIRAGFDLVFENEDDHSQSHCEFTATYKRTGKSFSVEAKHRAGNRFRLGRQLYRALKKQANHPRIVFIDINIPDDPTETEFPREMNEALNSIRAFEGKTINGRPLPEAYLFITNTPWHLHLDAQNIRCAVLIEGFQIPDFKGDIAAPSLRAAIDAREKHIEMHELLRSIRDRSEIPATFDGEIPEFAFSDANTRLLIGDRYLIAGEDGSERPGLLTSATVMEAEKKAMCILSFEDGTSGIYSWPLSDMEMTAWRKNRNTFFGQVDNNSIAKTPLELYDFFHRIYEKSSREKLLEFLAGAPDIKFLRGLDQPALASIYAERCTHMAMSTGGKTTTQGNLSGNAQES